MLEPAIFQRFRDIARNHAGIVLGNGKETLVEARIARRMRALGITSPSAYLDVLDDDQGDELIHFLDAISTNFTSFFREPDHFVALREEMQALRADGARRVRVWCAASSSGEEPYTIAMVLAEAFEGANIDWRILATDISTRILAMAKAGRYPVERLEGVNPALRKRWFSPVPGDAGTVEVRKELRERVQFARLNLAQPPFPMKGPLDVVFIRNVMIYFGIDTRQGLISEAQRLMQPEGLLIIGHAETLSGIRCNMQMVRPSVFRRTG